MQKILKSTKGKIIVSLVFVAVVASVWFYRDTLVALAGEFIDSFTDTTRVLDTWNINVDTAAGEVKLEQKSCDSANWICGAADLCANNAGDGAYILVASTTLGSRQWKTANTACDYPHCGQNGGQDGDNLVVDNTMIFTDYTAREACRLAGGRLPTIGELQCMYSYRTSFNNNFGTTYYWSSTEYSVTNARSVDFNDGNSSNDNKTYNYSVRCVRGW